MSAVQKGEKVLITGGTGWLGSHIVHEALAAGLQVRLAVRSEAKAEELLKSMKQLHGEAVVSTIETVTVTDFTKPGAFDEATKGVQGVVHTASDVSFSNDPKQVIDETVTSYRNILGASAKAKTVRRFVLTSSSAAVRGPNVDGKETVHVNASMYNDESVALAYQPDPSPLHVYSASKVLSEKAAWDYVEKEKPGFVVNSINPNAIFGRLLPGMAPRTTGSWVLEAAEGKDSMLEMLAPQHHVDVEDVSKLHIIGLMREDVKQERILAYGTKFTLNEALKVIKKVKPDSTPKAQTPDGDKYDNSIVDVSRAKDLLGGLHDIEYSFRLNLQQV